MKGQGKELEEPMLGAAAGCKPLAAKFGARGPKSNQQISNNSSVTCGLDQIHKSEKDITVSV